MSHDKIYSVATLGLQKNEVRFIKITLGFTSHATNTRTQGHYEYTDGLHAADIVIVDAGNDAAINIWHNLAARYPAKKLLLITAPAQIPFAKYFSLRPLGPSKVLMLLDKIVKDHKEFLPEVQAFTSAEKSESRGFAKLPQDSTPMRYRALVIDDSPAVRKMLVLELGCFNIKVDPAASGEAGLELLDENHYDIIFLDVVLPVIGGYDVCKMIRKNPKTKHIPVVMLTSKASPIDKIRGSLAGCNNYLTKPVDHENFYQVLESYLARPLATVGVDKMYG